MGCSWLIPIHFHVRPCLDLCLCACASVCVQVRTHVRVCVQREGPNKWVATKRKVEKRGTQKRNRERELKEKQRERGRRQREVFFKMHNTNTYTHMHTHTCTTCIAHVTHTLTHKYTHMHTCSTSRPLGISDLQLPATHCNTLQIIATYFNSLQLTATPCNSLQERTRVCDSRWMEALCACIHANACIHLANAMGKWAATHPTHGNVLQESARECTTLQETAIDCKRAQMCCSRTLIQPLRSTSRPPGVNELKVKSMYLYWYLPSATRWSTHSVSTSSTHSIFLFYVLRCVCVCVCV